MRRALYVGGLIAGMMATVAVASLMAVPGEPTAEDLAARYGIRADLKHYPQENPQQAIRSIVETSRKGEIAYLLAHLISPEQVDEKLKGDRQAFRKLVAKATPAKSKKMADALTRQLNQGRWTVRRDLAWVQVSGLPNASLQKVAGRWFMHNTPLPVPRRLVLTSP